MALVHQVAPFPIPELIWSGPKHCFGLIELTLINLLFYQGNAVEIIMLLPGQQAARVRRQAAELLCRYLGGDLAIVDEVCKIRGLQQQMAAESPNDPRRVCYRQPRAEGPSRKLVQLGNYIEKT